MDSAVAKTGAVVAVAEPAAPAGGEGEAEEGEQPTCAEFFFIQKGSGGKAIFLPNNTRFGAAKLSQLFFEFWKVKEPSTLIVADAGMVHPLLFATRALTMLPAFAKNGPWANAMKHTEMALPKDATAEEKEEKAMNVINDVLFLKLKTIFASVLDAAEIANNWIVIDRVNSKSPAAELLIEAAMAQTTSKPKVVVIDSLSRLKNFTCPQARACERDLAKIKKGGAPFGTDSPITQAFVSEFYPATDFMEPSVFYDLDAMPLPRPPEPVHAKEMPDRVKWQYHYLQTFFGSGTHYIVLESHHDCPDLSAIGPYGYVLANGQGPFYDRVKTRIQQGEALVMLHNTGGVVQAFCSLRKGMLSKVPVPESNELLAKLELVSPQPWAKNFGLPEILMMKELHQRAPMLLRNTCCMVDLLEDGSEQVLSVLTCCFSGGGGVPELGLGEAEKLCLLTAWKRHMTLIFNCEKFEKQADYLQLLLYFLAVATTVLSVLFTMEKNGNFPYLKDLTVGDVLAAADAAGANATAAAPAATNIFTDMTILSGTMLLLPIGTALVATMRSRLRPREKWATCLMAAMQIVDQIYKYRLRTEKYDTAKAPPPLPDGTIPDIPVKIRETNARANFVKTCSDIYSKAIQQEVSKGGALKMGKVAKLQTQKADGRREFESKLQGHVAKKLHAAAANIPKYKGGGGTEGAAAKKAAKAEAKKMAKEALKKKGGGKMLGGLLGKFGGKNNQIAAMAEGMMDDAMEQAVDATAGAAGKKATKDAGPDGEKEESATMDEIDDLVSQMAIETYIACRVRPLAQYLEQRSALIAKRNSRLEQAVVIFNTAGSALAILDQADYIAISVAVASQCMAIIDYFYIPAQLSTTNKALEDIHNLISWWDSLSLVQRKTRSTKLQCCMVTETCILSITSARTAESPALPGEAAEEEEE